MKLTCGSGISSGTINVRRRYLTKFSREVGLTTATEQSIIMWLGRPLSAKTRACDQHAQHVLRVGGSQPHVRRTTVARTSTRSRTSRSRVCMHDTRAHGKWKTFARQLPPPVRDAVLAVVAALAGCRCKEMRALLARTSTRTPCACTSCMARATRSGGRRCTRTFWSHCKHCRCRRGPLWDETAASISRKGNKFLHSLGIASTMHTLRHAFATKVYRASKDLRLTQELMGHSSPQTTAVYAAADQSQRQE